jgi:hypothetical protein
VCVFSFVAITYVCSCTLALLVGCLGSTADADTASTDEKNEKIKTMIRGKIEEYLGRAETLKTHLTAAEGKTKKAVGANGATKKGSVLDLSAPPRKL